MPTTKKRNVGNGAQDSAPETAVGLQSLDLNELYEGLPPARPVLMRATIEGTATMLFHRYDPDAVLRKEQAGKGSKEKKSDDIDSYYYRGPNGEVCIPAIGVHRCLVETARFYQDPRSARKSAMDLIKAVLIVDGAEEFPELIPVERDGETLYTADFIDKRRVIVQRSAVPRERPAVRPGWQATFWITLLAPNLITPQFVRRLLADGGMFTGLLDHRPQFGRFQVIQAMVEREEGVPLVTPNS